MFNLTPSEKSVESLVFKNIQRADIDVINEKRKRVYYVVARCFKQCLKYFF